MALEVGPLNNSIIPGVTDQRLLGGFSGGYRTGLTYECSLYYVHAALMNTYRQTLVV